MLDPSTLSAFRNELEKIARSGVKDFLAGVDPTGTKTFAYGVQDAPASKSEARKKMLLGTAGGLVGGAVVVPGAVSGLVEGAKGFASGGVRGAMRGAAKGAVKPFKGLARAVRGSKVLREAGEKGLKAKDLKGLGSLAEDMGVEGAGRAAARHARDITPAQIASAGPEAQEVLSRAAKKVRGRAIAGASTLGLSGAIGAGSAALQYQKGRAFGAPLTPEQRAQMA